MRRFLLTISLVFMGLITVKSQTSYSLVIYPNKVEVTLQMRPIGNSLEIWKGSNRTNDTGQIELFQNIRQVSKNGETPLKKVDKTKWEVSKDTQTVKYTVLLDYDNYTWGTGKEEMAFSINEGYYFTGRSLFLWQREAFEQIDSVKVDIENNIGGNLLSPWEVKRKGQNYSFILNDISELLYNFFVIGNYDTQTFQLGELALKVGYNEGLSGNKKLIEDVIKNGVSFYSNQLFPLNESKYIFFITDGDVNDGGAYTNGFGQTIRGTLNEKSLSVWGLNTLHEIFHLWNGRGVIFADESTEWFKEGATDYISILALAQLDNISKEIIIKKMENVFRKYTLATSLLSKEISLENAGQAKNENRMLIYGGGALVTMLIDLELREKGLSIFDVFKELYKLNQPVTNENLFHTVTKLTRNNNFSLTAFIKDKKQNINLYSIAKQLGVQLDIFGYEDIQLSVLEEKNQLRKSIFNF